MIPRSVKAWLFIYGLFFGSVIGGIFGIMGITNNLFWILLLAFVTIGFFVLVLIDWRKGDILKKWLPTEHETSIIQILKEIVGRDNANSTRKKAK